MNIHNIGAELHQKLSQDKTNNAEYYKKNKILFLIPFLFNLKNKIGAQNVVGNNRNREWNSRREKNIQRADLF